MNKYLSAFLSIFLLTMISCGSGRETGESLSQMRSYKLAMIQMKVKGGFPGLNLSLAAEKIKEASENGARIAVLPEALDFGWCHTSARKQAGPIPGGASFEALKKAAVENSIYVCAGIVEKDGENLYNSAVIISPAGKLLIKHRKLNELDFAHDLYDQGDRLNVVHTELGTLGLMICADAFTPEFALSKALGYMGADIILSPSAWAVPDDHDNVADPYGATWRNAYKPICEIFKVWFVGVSNVGSVDDGEWTGWNCIGCSLAYNHKGEEVIQGPYGEDAECILYIDVELQDRPARGTEWQLTIDD
jgi:predicted amidohydrolase